MKKFKKVIYLFAILLLPSIMYFLLYTGEHHYKKLPYIGPKKAIQNENGKYDTIYHQIPYFEFTNQDGGKITRDDMLGHIYVVDFFFVTCPTICPKMTTNMAYIQNKFKDRKDLRFLSITVNPEYDTEAVLAEHAKKVHADTKTWDFLTGEKDKIYDVAFNGFFVSAQRDSIAPGGFLHSGMLILLDKNAHIRGYFDGTTHKVIKEQLTDAIDILYKEDYLALKGKEKDKIEQRR
ncbi:MAG: SCO family protein [Flavobacteriales bacterium]|nr:SCO family protein [Flavobacteriales bacterium]MCB9336098.1 SCO family protein [Flavobacteriales bacterium]